MRTFVLILLASLIIISCQNNPTQATLAGKYIISSKLKDSKVIKDDIQKNVSDAMKDVKIDLDIAKDNLNDDLSLENIDTTTPEGKIEYGAKVFGKSLAEAGLSMGQNAKELGDYTSVLGSQGLDFFDNMLANTNLDVELQADGDIKISGLARLLASNVTWSVNGEYFILNLDDKKSVSAKIISHDDKGFIAEYEKFVITAIRK